MQAAADAICRIELGKAREAEAEPKAASEPEPEEPQPPMPTYPPMPPYPLYPPFVVIGSGGGMHRRRSGPWRRRLRLRSPRWRAPQSGRLLRIGPRHRARRAASPTTGWRVSDAAGAADRRLGPAARCSGRSARRCGSRGPPAARTHWDTGRRCAPTGSYFQPAGSDRFAARPRPVDRRVGDQPTTERTNPIKGRRK